MFKIILIYYDKSCIHISYKQGQQYDFHNVFRKQELNISIYSKWKGVSESSLKALGIF